MKRAYVRPTMVGERFVANEYVAACGDSGKVYKFECNAGKKSSNYNVYYKDGDRKKFIVSNNIFDRPQRFGNYHPCGTTHEANAKDEFIAGYIDDQLTLKDEAIPVVIWTQNGKNVHCTLELNINEWQTAKS